MGKSMMRFARHSSTGRREWCTVAHLGKVVGKTLIRVQRILVCVCVGIQSVVAKALVPSEGRHASWDVRVKRKVRGLNRLGEEPSGNHLSASWVG